MVENPPVASMQEIVPQPASMESLPSLLWPLAYLADISGHSRMGCYVIDTWSCNFRWWCKYPNFHLGMWHQTTGCKMRWVRWASWTLLWSIWWLHTSQASSFMCGPCQGVLSSFCWPLIRTRKCTKERRLKTHFQSFLLPSFGETPSFFIHYHLFHLRIMKCDLGCFPDD